MLFTRERQGACLERRNSTVQLTLPGKRACFQWWQRRWMAFGFPIQCTFCPGKTDCKGAGRPAGNRICHRKLLYCQIPGKQSSCYYRGSHSGTGYRESQLYLYVPAESPERSESLLPSGEKYLSLHYRKRERVSEAESYGFRASPGGKGDSYRMA
mgnify:CR=1 FL=1